MKVVMSIFLTSDWAFLLFMKCEMDIFSSWIEIAIGAMNYDFPKCIVLFSMKREVPILYSLWIVKGLFFFLQNVIYTPPYQIIYLSCQFKHSDVK